MTQTLNFAPFGPEHLDAALRLSREAGWPHRREDWALVQSVSQGVVALEDDRVVATALATPFGPVGMVNMIIVDETMRGRGLGREIMQQAMALAQPQEWRLVATQAGLPLYLKLGFVECGLVHQHQGHVAGLPTVKGVRWAEASDLPAIVAMDRDTNGADRATLLTALAKRGRIALIDGKGFAVLRDFGRGHVVGPVVAQDDATARDLLGFVLAGRGGEFMRVDTTDETDIAGWLQDIGLARVDTGIAMRRGDIQARTGAFQRFALAAQALG